MTLYYPTVAPDRPVQRGSLRLQLALQAAPAPGHGRRVVISHGSGASPWVYTDLARQWVAAGFAVAPPQRQVDNYRDPSRHRPDSWALWQAVVSRAIDAVGQEARLAPLLALDRVGVYVSRPPATRCSAWLARTVTRWAFRDDTPQAHRDLRVLAVVAGVPLAADFDLATLPRSCVLLSPLSPASSAAT